MSKAKAPVPKAKKIAPVAPVAPKLEENSFLALKIAKSKHEDPLTHIPDGHEEIEIPHEPLKPIVKDEPKVGRNEPCPCGSGLKYKKCCGKE